MDSSPLFHLSGDLQVADFHILESTMQSDVIILFHNLQISRGLLFLIFSYHIRRTLFLMDSHQRFIALRFNDNNAH